tara:strand:+ start:477 stop:626 length:150 start_codon:yes stop_codon:yes gene_type:complete
MPIHIRRFHCKRINDLHEEQNKEHQKIMDKANQHTKAAKSPNIPKNFSS